ncbi:hypothetical protein L596_019418 [Steinernema carpocapsae]|uniref:Uncharacterized protein n=1 Tax=Steinernema carpocapsae TaxID=34508 RepID=A0A4U5MQF8_STECR|nr:hypothetical protein L596_019418 [Steinernema carpocapsae]
MLRDKTTRRIVRSRGPPAKRRKRAPQGEHGTNAGSRSDEVKNEKDEVAMSRRSSHHCNATWQLIVR